MRMISQRISLDEAKNFSIVILGKIERWKESLLLYWLLAWTFCGSVFIYQFFGNTPFHHSIPMLILIAFFLYFELRILKVFLYRRKGYEHLVFSENELIIHNKIFPKGSKTAYDINMIESFNPIAYSKKNFFSFMEDSFWVIGGQRIYFTYGNKKVIFGMQLSELEIKKLLSLLNGQLKQLKRDYRAKMKQQKREL